MIHLLHLPKTGGSALGDALWPYRQTFDIRVHGHEVTLANIPPDKTVVFAVRDPVERFCSGFNSRLRQGRPRNDVPWSPAESLAFSRFSTPNQLAESLAAENEARRSQAMAAVSAVLHLAPLRRWIDSPERLETRSAATFILSQSSLSEDFEALKARLGLPRQASLPDDPVRAHRTPPEYEVELSPAGRAAVLELYRDDEPILERCLMARRAWLSGSAS